MIRCEMELVGEVVLMSHVAEINATFHAISLQINCSQDFLIAREVDQSTMSRKAVLLIGGLTHAEKEWKAWTSKYILKVDISTYNFVTIADSTPRNLLTVQERTF